MAKGDGTKKKLCVCACVFQSTCSSSLALKSKASRPSLFIHNAGSCYCCGRLKWGRKEQHAWPTLSDAKRGEDRGLNQIISVISAHLPLSTFWHRQRRVEARDQSRSTNRWRQRQSVNRKTEGGRRGEGEWCVEGGCKVLGHCHLFLTTMTHYFLVPLRLV